MNNDFEHGYEDSEPDYNVFERRQLDLDAESEREEAMVGDEEMPPTTLEAIQIHAARNWQIHEVQEENMYAMQYIAASQALALERIANALENPIADPRPFQSVVESINSLTKAMYSQDK